MFSFFKPSREKAAKALQSGKFDAAIKQYRRLLKDDPENHELIHDLGVALLGCGQFAEAIACFKEANTLHEDSKHWNNLGRAFLELKEFQNANDAFEVSAKLDPKDPQPRYNLTVCFREQGDAELAFLELQYVSEQFPEHVQAHNDLALFFEEASEHDKAFSHLEKALQLEPAHIPARINMIQMLFDQARVADAEPHLKILKQWTDVSVVINEEGQRHIVLLGLK